MTVRLPIPGSDDGTWGNLLNTFLQVSHNNDGTLNVTAVGNALPNPIPVANLGSGTPSSSNFLRGDGIWAVPSGGGVSSVFGRTGAVVARANDYTAAQVGALSASDDLSAIATANATAADVSLNSHRITNLANGSASNDAAAFGQIPTQSQLDARYAQTGSTNTWSAAQTFNNGELLLAGSTSGTTILEASAAASGTLTLPATTDTVVTLASTQTLTNKRVTTRVSTLTVSSNTYTIPADNCDVAIITTAPIADFTMAAPSPSTPTDGQLLMLRITSGATGFTPTWDAIFINSGIATLPTTALPANKTVTFGFQYSLAKNAWVLLAYDGVGF